MFFLIFIIIIIAPHEWCVCVEYLKRRYTLCVELLQGLCDISAIILITLITADPYIMFL